MHKFMMPLEGLGNKMETYKINKIEPIETIVGEMNEAIVSGDYAENAYHSPRNERQEIGNPYFKNPIKSVIKYIFNVK